MTATRLRPAAAAILLFVAFIAGGAFYAQREATRYVHTLAPQMFPEKHRGVMLQRAAFRQHDLLPFYGSSELSVPNRYHASALFRDYPTGFTVFPVGNIGSTSLVWLQSLVAVGDGVRGRKVAVSVSARAFADDGVDRHAYAANFSALHANRLAFSSHLSFALKQESARRMLQFPETLADDPLLTFALEQLAADSLAGRTLYYAAVPLGRLHTALLDLQYRWATLVFLRAQLGMAKTPRHTVDLDWDALVKRAEQETRQSADTNPLGFENTFWAAHAPDIAWQRQTNPSEGVRAGFTASAEWTDLDLLLRAIRDLGGEPLLLSIPINEAYYDYINVSASTRQIYYDRVRQVAKANAVPIVEFNEGDTEEYFTADAMFHLSAKGWVFYNRALDAFFHDQPPGAM
jgi:D-alanine transfer protein